jgi:hypothetical protein
MRIGRIESLEWLARAGCVCAVVLVADQNFAQAIYEPYYFATIVGGSRSRVGAGFIHSGTISQMAVDPSGNVYFNSDQLLLKRSTSGFVSTVAGGNTVGGVDGTGPMAGFTEIDALAVSANGTVYVADAGSLRQVTADGKVTTMVPSLGTAFSSGEISLAVDAEGDAYLANGGPEVTQVSSKGTISMLSDTNGNPIVFQEAVAAVVDSSDNVLVMDALAGDITRVSPNGATSVVGVLPSSPNHDATCFAVDEQGNFYIEEPPFLYKVAAGGAVSTLAVPSNYGLSGGGLGLDPGGTLYFLDNPGGSLSGDVSAITPSGGFTVLTTPNFVYGASDGSGPHATISNPSGVAVDTHGDVYFLDQGGAEVRKVSPTGLVTTLAGTPTYGSSDGVGSAAQFSLASGIAVDGAGNLYVSDTFNDTIRKVTPEGTVTTLAGSAGIVGSADGMGSAARFYHPSGIAIDASGNLFVADTGNNTVRKIAPGGMVSTYAGTASATPGYLDGPAATAQFSGPTGVAVDPEGNIYVGDTVGALTYSGGTVGSTGVDTSHTVMQVVATVRKITPTGAVSTLAGTPYTDTSTTIDYGTFGTTTSTGYKYGDGTGASVFFGSPFTLAADSAGNVYVADLINNVVRKVTPQGAVTTLGGSPTGFSMTESDGAGASAGFGSPTGIAVDANGNVFVSDLNAIRVGAVSGYPEVPTEPILNWALVPLAVAPDGNVTLAVPSVKAIATSYQWYFDGTPISGATGSSLPLADVAQAKTGYFECVGTNSFATNTTEFSVSVESTFNPGRLINLSCRARSGVGDKQVIVGFVIGGRGTSGYLPVLVRGSGPALASFGLSGTLPDPNLTLNESVDGTNIEVGTNQGWGGSTLIADTANQVDAFAWEPTSADAALVTTLGEGSFTAQLSGASNDAGLVLAEVYDATPSGTYTIASPRLIDISARGEVGTGGNVLIAGFVIGGTTSETVLIRASGPALGDFGLTKTLPDPQLSLFQSNSDGSSTLLDTNTGWGGNPQIATSAANVGAFSWGTTATPDSAILVTLQPGVYTAEVAGASGDTGLALVEVYEVQ